MVSPTRTGSGYRSACRGTASPIRRGVPPARRRRGRRRCCSRPCPRRRGAGTGLKLTDLSPANGSRARPAAVAAVAAARSTRIGRPSTASTRTTRRGTTGTKTKSSQTKSRTLCRTLATRTATAALPAGSTRPPRPPAPACSRGRARVAPAERAESSQSPACPVAFARSLSNWSCSSKSGAGRDRVDAERSKVLGDHSIRLFDSPLRRFGAGEKRKRDVCTGLRTGFLV